MADRQELQELASRAAEAAQNTKNNSLHYGIVIQLLAPMLQCVADSVDVPEAKRSMEEFGIKTEADLKQLVAVASEFLDAQDDDMQMHLSRRSSMVHALDQLSAYVKDKHGWEV